MVVDRDRADQPSGRLWTGDHLGAGATEWFRRLWSDPRQRRRLVLGTVAVAAVAAIAVAALLFASLAGESQSYRDGYAVGDSVYTSFEDASLTAQQACRDRGSEPGQIPRGDDVDQWVSGCVAGFTFAQSDE